MAETPPPQSEHSGLFPNTAWSRIHAGVPSSGASDAEVKEALEDICRRYWQPAHKFLRSIGCSREDAEDIAQTFFAKWAKPESLEALGPEKGRLRSYLKQALRRHFISHWREKTALRRGGDKVDASLDQVAEPSIDDEAADLQYDIAWAETVLGTVLAGMSQAYEARGKGELFEILSGALPGGGGLKPYAEICVSAGVKENQLKVEIHRLKRRFTKALREEISSTLANDEDLEDELRHLVRVMAHVDTQES